MTSLYIFLGGGLGALSRYGLSFGIQSLAENTRFQRFPLGIFACNLLGCFLIGLIFGFIASRSDQHPAWLHPLAVTGFLGGFTTFSTFALDSHQLFSSSPALALLNIAASVIGCLFAVWLGFKILS
ncbi:putative fluoride ion transporter CrcB [Oceaniferula spumae]|uniref:Fluoride-specific ion channel FluC n=1 Tax=Oceaniferula spumae TaxID=2979115 RepID=A0AAT9FGV5_9BACT